MDEYETRYLDQVGNCQQYDGVGNRHEPEGHRKKFIGVEHDRLAGLAGPMGHWHCNTDELIGDA